MVYHSNMVLERWHTVAVAEFQRDQVEMEWQVWQVLQECKEQQTLG